MRAEQIDATRIASFQAALSKEVSSRTTNLEVTLLRIVLKSAKFWAPIADDYKSLREDRRGPGRALDDDQERLLFDTARSRPGWDTTYYAALTAANTTMRSCELKGLRLVDINLVDRESMVGRSKTDAGRRRIPLNSAAVWALSRLLERAGALGSVAPEHFLFPRFRYRETKAAGTRNRIRSDAGAKEPGALPGVRS